MLSVPRYGRAVQYHVELLIIVWAVQNPCRPPKSRCCTNIHTKEIIWKTVDNIYENCPIDLKYSKLKLSLISEPNIANKKHDSVQEGKARL